MCGVFYPKSGVFLDFWVVFWVGVFGLWGGVLGPWSSGHTAGVETRKHVEKFKNKNYVKICEQYFEEVVWGFRGHFYLKKWQKKVKTQELLVSFFRK